ncbi:MAG: FGGY family carbohydrate kinase, partial [Acidobacteriota bacterium]
MSAEVPRDQRALVAIDLGAESCRVSLLRWVDEKPQVRLVHRFANNAVTRGDELHWDLQGILRGLDEGLRKSAEIATEGVRSIAVDGWGVDYVRLDADGNVVSEPFCYRDQRTVASEAALHQRISPQRMRDITGVQLMQLNTVYQLAADAPELQKLRWLNLPEYVLYSLGGRPVAELTTATHTQLVGLDGKWSSEIFAALGQDEALAAEIVAPGTDVGLLRGELAKLPAFAETR